MLVETVVIFIWPEDDNKKPSNRSLETGIHDV